MGANTTTTITTGTGSDTTSTTTSTTTTKPPPLRLAETAAAWHICITHSAWRSCAAQVYANGLDRYNTTLDTTTTTSTNRNDEDRLDLTCSNRKYHTWAC